MAVDLHGTGVSVKLIEPGPIDTEIWDQPDNDDPIYDGPKFSPEQVAAGIITALGGDRFEHYVPEMKAVVDVKNADIDGYIAGAGSAPTRSAHYLDLVVDGRVDLRPMLTHTFRLEQWRDAFLAIANQGDSGAVKVAIDQR